MTHEPPDPIIPSPPNHPGNSFQRRRPLFWLALAFCAGIMADAFLAPALATLGGLVLATFIAALAVLLRKTTVGGTLGSAGDSRDPGGAKRPAYSRNYAVCAIVLSLAGGALVHALRARIAPGDDVSRRTSALPSFMYVRGTLIDVSGGGSTRHDAATTEMAGLRAPLTERPALWTVAVDALGPEESALTPASGRVRVTYRIEESDAQATELAGLRAPPTEGARVLFRARLEAPPELTLPGSFDYGQYLENQNIHRVGAIFPQTLRVVADGTAWWRLDLYLRGLSAGLARRVESALDGFQTDGTRPGSQAALLNALLFGRRENVENSDRDAFALSGTAHLLAISGLQIQFLAWLLWRAAAWFGLSRRKAAGAVLAICTAYCALAGADPPILRASVMIALYLLAVLAWREPEPLSVLGASALAILFFSPAELFNAGFQLSFLAVLALVTLYPALEDAWEAWRRGEQTQIVLPEGLEQPQRNHWLGYVRTSLFVTLAAWMGTAPVVAWHMGRFATLSLLVNLVAVPLSNVCMVLGLLMLAAGLVSSVLAQGMAYVTFGSLVALQSLIHVFAAVPGASIDIPPPAVPLIIMYATVLVYIWRERKTERSLGRLSLLFGACLLALNAGLFFREPAAAGSVTILDLPRGRAALVESPEGGAALIDAGGAGDGARIAEVLRKRGISRLALLVISVDNPEAIGGASELLKHVPAVRVLMPREASANTARRDLERFLTANQTPYGPADVTQPLLGPGDIRWDFCDDGHGPDEKAANQTALCVRVSVPGASGRESVLFLAARSNASLQRLRQNLRTRERVVHSDMLQAGIVRVTPGAGGAWPGDLENALTQSHCRVVVAGSRSEPDESVGVNLESLAQAHDLKLLWPHRDGSVRVQADVGARTAQTLQAFRGGVWREIP